MAESGERNAVLGYKNGVQPVLTEEGIANLNRKGRLIPRRKIDAKRKQAMAAHEEQRLKESESLQRKLQKLQDKPLRTLLEEDRSLAKMIFTSALFSFRSDRKIEITAEDMDDAWKRS